MPAPSDVSIRRAQPADLGRLWPLFDAYRSFYGKASDPALAQAFLSKRLSQGDSAVFLAFEADKAIGFTQLYPTFSSLSGRRVWTLNDLFVAPEGRGRGVGRALMETAAAFARSSGAVRIELTTALTNGPAQALYESQGYVRDTYFCAYSLEL